jgi:hypothetical protein
MSKGYNQSDIAKELHTTRSTVLRDVVFVRNGTLEYYIGNNRQSDSSHDNGINMYELVESAMIKNNDNDLKRPPSLKEVSSCQ